MTTLLSEPISESDVKAQLPGVRRQAFYLPVRGQSAFAFLHIPEPASWPRRAALICPPIGYEQIHAHRALRHLADELALAGLITCRIDYPGTGDSSGSDADPDRLISWQASIREAALWLRNVQGCSEVHLVGLRLGALLAMRVAAEIHVDGLVAWAPMLKGGQYVREMQALELTSQPQANPPQAAREIEAAGFLLSEQTATDIAALDALTIQPQCRRALIVARDDRADDRKLLDHLAALHIDARQIRVPGFTEMMAEPHKTVVPKTAIDEIAEFLRESALESSPSPPSNRNEPSPLSLPAEMTTDDYRESVANIAGPPDLFGILTEPVREASDHRPLIVILNAGAAYHVGPNRLHVSLARNLAANGFRSVRIDSARLGDSVPPQNDVDINTYSSSIFCDVDHIITHARVHWNARRVVVLGLCSGAYFAFQSAAQFSNPALIESIMINPLAFFWADGMSVQAPEKIGIAAFDYHMRSVWQPSKLWKFFTGRSKIGIVGASKVLVSRLRSGGHGDIPTGSIQKMVDDGQVNHPDHEHLAWDIQSAVAKGRRLTFVFSEADPGHSILKHFAGALVKKLCRAGTVEISVINKADHTFTRRDARRQLFETLIRHFVKRYPL